MKAPAWLAEFHRQWLRARGGRADAAARAFRRDWEKLLDEAGLRSAEDREAARREAAALPQLHLIPFKSKPRFIHRIELPLESEAWLHELFDSRSGSQLQEAALRAARTWQEHRHPLLAELWEALLTEIATQFAAGSAASSFSWRAPEAAAELLDLLWHLTAREWPQGTLIRDASTALGRDSKCLEARQPAIERALELLFGRETPLEALGIQTRHSVLHFSGPLTLHFEDGSTFQTDTLRFESTLPIAELERAARVTTPAERLLTVENRKTTFLQLARADTRRATLIVATSFPTQAVRRLLEKLPSGLPHFHFGDTDPAGFDILRRLRETSPRPVRLFHMDWRPRADAPPLTARERQILDRLLADELMNDARETLAAMRHSGLRGDYEQESLGPPDLPGWPFYRALAGQLA